jgi:hypothetical protein
MTHGYVQIGRRNTIDLRHGGGWFSWPIVLCQCGAEVPIPGYDPAIGPWPSDADAAVALRDHLLAAAVNALEGIAEELREWGRGAGEVSHEDA